MGMLLRRYHEKTNEIDKVKKDKETSEKNPSKKKVVNKNE